MTFVEAILWAGGIATALLALMAMLIKTFQVTTRIAAPHFAAAVKEALQPSLDHINRELVVNGGESVKDVTTATAETLQHLEGQVEEYLEHQGLQNNDILNAISKLGMFVRTLHRGDLEDMGWTEDDFEELVIIKEKRLEEVRRQEQR